MGRTIVVGIDGSEQAGAALRWAAAQAERDGAVLSLLHGWEARASSSEARIASAAAALVDQTVAAVASDHPGLVVKGESVRRAPAAALIDASGAADLVVVGSRGHGGFAGLLLGSVGQQCIHHARSPVAVVRESDGEVHGRVVVGVDGSRSSLLALEWAVDEAERRRAAVRVVCAWHYPPVGAFVIGPDEGYDGLASQVVEEASAPYRERVTIELEERFGPAAGVLLEAAERADLLVVGSRGHGGFRELLLGSTGSECAHHARCPVVVVR